MNYKVLIPSAGLGTRLGKYSKHINKAMVTVGNKPAICHIIEKFPVGVNIVIAIGHRGELLKQFLTDAYLGTKRHFEFIDIDKYEGVGSGLGYTLLKCKYTLQCPFVFCSNDTLVTDEIPAPDHNWIGYADVGWIGDQYRGIGFMPRIHIKDKGSFPPYTVPYIGLAGIKDYEDFWVAMVNGINSGSIEMGESYALNKLNFESKKRKSFAFNWYDIGTQEGLERANRELQTKPDTHILPKEDEAIWFVNNKVIKYHNDPKFISNRAKRAELLFNFVPQVVTERQNYYIYYEVRGKTLSSCIDHKLFSNFLRWMDTLWIPIETIDVSYGNYYRKKTVERMIDYLKLRQTTDLPETINGQKVPKLMELIDRVPWRLFNNTSSRIHGDLHPENVLVAEDGRFVLLDWRQDFDGVLESGDKNYDLAKLNHGLIVSHEVIHQNQYSITKNDDIINFDFRVPYKLLECQQTLQEYVGSFSKSWKAIDILTALIFINNAPLHHTPYNDLLYYLGKYKLHQLLQ